MLNFKGMQEKYINQLRAAIYPNIQYILIIIIIFTLTAFLLKEKNHFRESGPNSSTYNMLCYGCMEVDAG